MSKILKRNWMDIATYQGRIEKGAGAYPSKNFRFSKTMVFLKQKSQDWLIDLKLLHSCLLSRWPSADDIQAFLADMQSSTPWPPTFISSLRPCLPKHDTDNGEHDALEVSPIHKFINIKYIAVHSYLFNDHLY